jgi:transposase InsO family protein
MRRVIGPTAVRACRWNLRRWGIRAARIGSRGSCAPPVCARNGARQFRVTTDSTHAAPIAPNVLAREFAVTTIPRPNQVWTSDITYIATREGWFYLAIVLDLRSRRVVGWAMRHTLEWELARDALVMPSGSGNRPQG